MNVNHTKSPWQIAKPTGQGTAHKIWRNDEGPNGNPETNTNYVPICRDVHNPADAALIAAAPELLDALKAIVRNYDLFTSHEVDTQEISDARTAIAKAEGRS